MSETSNPTFTSSLANEPARWVFVRKIGKCLAPYREPLKFFFCAAWLNAVLFAVFLSCFTIFYETNDDPNMQWIASGFYTGHPSEYLIFTNVLIGWLLRFSFCLCPACNWYLLYLLGVHYVSLTTVAFVILRRCSHWLFILLYVGFFLLVEVRNLLNLQFTTTAFLAGTAGSLLLVDSLRPSLPIQWPGAVAGMGLVALMGMIRELVTPFLVLIALPFVFERFGLVGLRRLAAVGLVAVALFLSFHELNHWYYQRDPVWREYVEYNTLRGKIHDTPLKNSLSQVCQAAGWSDNDAWLFNHDYFADPDVFASLPNLRLLVSKLESTGRSFQYSEALSPTNLLLPKLWGLDAGALFDFAVLNAIACLVLAGTHRRRWFATLVSMYFIFVAITFYFRTTSRLPQRVSYCMPLFVHAILLYWATDLPSTPQSSHLVQLFKRLFSLGERGWVLRWAGAAAVPIWIMLYVSGLASWTRCLSYTNGSNYYLKTELAPKIMQLVRASSPPNKSPVIIPVLWDAPLVQSLYFHAVPGEIPLSLLPYSWLPHSPLYIESLERHHLRPYALSLLNRPEVFFLMDGGWIGPLQTFYRQHLALSVSFERVLDTDEMPQSAGCRLHLYRGHALDRGSGLADSSAN